MGASPELKQLKLSTIRRRAADRLPAAPESARAVRESAALRLLSAERSEEIFPLLLEEIIALGNPRALVVDVNFDSGEVSPAAALKWPHGQMEKFSSALWMQEHPHFHSVGNARPQTAGVSSERPQVLAWTCSTETHTMALEEP